MLTLFKEIRGTLVEALSVLRDFLVIISEESFSLSEVLAGENAVVRAGEGCLEAEVLEYSAAFHPVYSWEIEEEQSKYPEMCTYRSLLIPHYIIGYLNISTSCTDRIYVHDAYVCKCIYLYTHAYIQWKGIESIDMIYRLRFKVSYRTVAKD